VPVTLRHDWPAEGVLRITLAKPEKLNALDHRMLDEIAATLDATDAKCVVITGGDGIFSAGYDIGGLNHQDDFMVEAEKLVAHPCSSAMDALQRFDRPTVAAIGGCAIGGGLELAVACDFRIAAGDATLGMPPARLGLVYSHTGLRRFMDAIGEPRTRELFLLGENVDAATALGWGLVNRVVAVDQLQDAAIEVGARFAANSSSALAGNKQALRLLLDAKWHLGSALEHELLELRRASFASEDLREGLRAFSEKRRPRRSRQ
jgi:enoyl-CoA hydratase/carnithine racemase